MNQLWLLLLTLNIRSLAEKDVDFLKEHLIPILIFPLPFCFCSLALFMQLLGTLTRNPVHLRLVLYFWGGVISGIILLVHFSLLPCRHRARTLQILHTYAGFFCEQPSRPSRNTFYFMDVKYYYCYYLSHRNE